MKKIKMISAAIVFVVLTFMVTVSSIAATFSYEKEAKQLNEIGLYVGISEEEFVPDLNTSLDRQTGVVMLLRMFGQEEEAKSLTEEQTNDILAKFTDAETIADWAKKHVAYAVDNGIVKEVVKGLEFKPAASLSGKAYASLLLQELGYDGKNDYMQAVKELDAIGRFNASQVALFNSDDPINKDSLVGISYGSLQAVTKEGKKLINVLIEKDVVSKVDVIKAEIPYNESELTKTAGDLESLSGYVIRSVEASEDIKVMVGETPVLPATVTVTFENDITTEVMVTWSTVDTFEAGEQVIEGTIKGYAIKVKVKVIVLAKSTDPDREKAEIKPTNASLTNLILNGGTLDPDFDPSITSYNVNVSNDVTSVNVMPTVEVGSTEIKMGEKTISSGAEFTLSEGINTVIVTVSETGLEDTVYVIYIDREVGEKESAVLGSLSVVECDLIPAFSPDITNYNVQVSNSMTETGIRVEVESGSATISFDGKTVENDEHFSLAVGKNAVTITVDEEDKKTNVYTVTVTRAEDLPDAKLSSLVFNKGTMDKPFVPDETFYEVEVDNEVTSINVTPTAETGIVEVSFEGSIVESYNGIPLNVGLNIMVVTVEAEGMDKTSYWIYITRKALT